MDISKQNTNDEDQRNGKNDTRTNTDITTHSGSDDNSDSDSNPGDAIITTLSPNALRMIHLSAINRTTLNLFSSHPQPYVDRTSTTHLYGGPVIRIRRTGEDVVICPNCSECRRREYQRAGREGNLIRDPFPTIQDLCKSPYEQFAYVHSFCLRGEDIEYDFKPSPLFWPRLEPADDTEVVGVRFSDGIWRMCIRCIPDACGLCKPLYEEHEDQEGI